MPADELLCTRVRGALKRTAGVSEKKMFGGLSFLVNGNMACGVIDDKLVVRVGPTVYEDCLARPHATKMDFTGRPMKGWVYVLAPGHKTDEDLKSWVKKGVAFARSLPAK